MEWVKELRGDRNLCEKNIVLALVATKSNLLDVDAIDGGLVGVDGDDEYKHGGEKKNIDLNIVSMAHDVQVLQQLNHDQATQLYSMKSSMNTTSTFTNNTNTATTITTSSKVSGLLSSSSSPSFLSSSQQYQQQQKSQPNYPS